MSLNIQIGQEANLSQQLNLAPQLLQWLRLLHVPTMELSAMVRHEIESNPALETEEMSNEFDTLDPATENEELSEPSAIDEKQDFLLELDKEWGEDWTGGSQAGLDIQEDAQEKRSFMMESNTSKESQYEKLVRQLALESLSEEERELAEIVIGSLDNRGYIAFSNEDLVSMTGKDSASVERAIAAVQSLHPAGIGARSLRECLLLQMADRPADFLPKVLVENFLDALALGRFANIAEKLNVDEKDVKEAARFIASLDPAPGETFIAENPSYIEPDAIISYEENHGWRIEINDDSLPRLRISSACRNLLKKNSLTPEESAYVRNKIRAASFFVQGIRQRHETLYKVCDQIVRFQDDYFKSEQGELKPLTMAKLAAMLGVHETTVCRALANKHVQTPRGLFEMKHFFRSGYACADGSYVTPEQVKSLIQDIVEKEDPLHPRRDTDIVEMLKKQGLKVARRTVAKYREEMGLDSSKERKKAAQQSRETPRFKSGKSLQNPIREKITAVA